MILSWIVVTLSREKLLNSSPRAPGLLCSGREGRLQFAEFISNPENVFGVVFISGKFHLGIVYCSILNDSDV